MWHALRMSSAIQKDWLTRKEAAQHLCSLGYLVNHRKLERMAHENYGPPFRKPADSEGGRTAYNRDELERWARSFFMEIRPPARRQQTAA